jgi:hypothetical protein
MFLFLPLGWFSSAAQALILWYALQIALAALSVVLLWRLFFPGGDPVDLAACLVLLCACHGTQLTFDFAQTNFMALAAFLLFWRQRNTMRGGGWAALALCAKPFLAVVAVWLLVTARWRALAGLVLALGVLLLAALVVFGPRTSADYFVGDHLAQKPAWIYSQPTNQSLLGFVLRVRDAECAGARCVLDPWFVAGAAGLALGTLALCWQRRGSADDEWSLALLLVWVLLAYPVSQVFYSVLLVPVLLLAWRERVRVPGGALGLVPVTAAVYTLCALSNGRRTVYAFALVWLALALASLALRSPVVSSGGSDSSAGPPGRTQARA